MKERIKVEKICKQCNNKYFVFRYLSKKSKFCSHNCYSKNLKGKKSVPCSEEKKIKISLANKGEKNGMYGKKYCSKKCFSKVSSNNFIKGATPWNKGIKCPKISQSKIGKKRPDMIGNKFNVGRKAWNKGKVGIHLSPNSEFKKGFFPWNKGKSFLAISGEKNHFWKGGVTKLVEKIRKSKESKEWRLKIYERDKFICQMPSCNKVERFLNVHHIKKFSKILQENSIKTLEQAIGCKELWDIDNGITLCKTCHKVTKYKEEQYVNLFKEILNITNT